MTKRFITGIFGSLAVLVAMPLAASANTSPNIGRPVHPGQCRHWEKYTTPSFTDQDNCVAFVNARAHGDLTMSDPSQHIVFNIATHRGAVSDIDEKGFGRMNTVQYTNFDYPGGLQYKANVICANINTDTKEARFMFRIPEGHPGLSGLYVVSYVKDNGVEQEQAIIYGHAATSDYETAVSWCQMGTEAGFNPSLYPVTGNQGLEFEQKD